MDKAKILIIDDEPGILEVYSELLKDAGFEVDIALNGTEGMQKAERKRYNLILLDIMMNVGPDGLECLKIMKSDPDKYGKVIIIMLTNLALTNNIKEAFDHGAEGYLLKLTLSNDQVVKKVRGFLHGFGEK